MMPELPLVDNNFPPLTSVFIEFGGGAEGGRVEPVLGFAYF